MNQNNKVHSSSSRVGNTPFSWENQPGVTKTHHVVGTGSYHHEPFAAAKLIKVLPPPPCQKHHSDQILRTSSSRKGYSKEQQQQDHDPFLAAYEACTKSGRKKQQPQQQGQGLGKKKKRSEGKNNSMVSLFSCRRSCGVREDSLVKLSHVSPSLRRDRLRFDAD